MQIYMISAHALCKGYIYFKSMSMCMWAHILHVILFVTEIALDKINHAATTMLCLHHTGHNQWDTIVVQSCSCF